MKKIFSVLTALALILALLMGSACASTNQQEDFREIFQNRSIVPELVGNKWYAYVSPEGIVDLIQFFAYGDDVHTMINTQYYPFHDLSGEAFREAELNLRLSFFAISCEVFTEVGYRMESGYYVANVRYNDLDKAENVRALVEHDIVSQGSEVISLSKTIQALEASGYITGEYAEMSW